MLLIDVLQEVCAGVPRNFHHQRQVSNLLTLIHQAATMHCQWGRHRQIPIQMGLLK